MLSVLRMFSSFICRNFKAAYKDATVICDSSDYQDIAECDLTQGDQSCLEALQSLGDPIIAPTPSHINEVDLLRDLPEFSRKMRCK